MFIGVAGDEVQVHYIGTCLMAVRFQPVYSCLVLLRRYSTLFLVAHQSSLTNLRAPIGSVQGFMPRFLGLGSLLLFLCLLFSFISGFFFLFRLEPIGKPLVKSNK